MDYYTEFTKQKIILEATDPMNPDVHVDGFGTYDLKTLKANVRRQLLELAQSVDSDDPRVWRNAKHDMDSGVLQAKINAIVSAHDALQAQRRKGGPKSRGISPE
jgi:hypothetical protein